jgi:hypothetical protein
MVLARSSSLRQDFLDDDEENMFKLRVRGLRERVRVKSAAALAAALLIEYVQVFGAANLNFYKSQSHSIRP